MTFKGQKKCLTFCPSIAPARPLWSRGAIYPFSSIPVGGNFTFFVRRGDRRQRETGAMPLNFDAIIDITIKFTAKCLKIHYGWQGFEPASSPYLTLHPNLCVTVASWKLASNVRNLFRKVDFDIDIDVDIDSNIGLKQGLNEKKKSLKTSLWLTGIWTCILFLTSAVP